MKSVNAVCVIVMALLLVQLAPSCALNRVQYSRQIDYDGTLVRIVLLERHALNELVIGMQTPGCRIIESVFLVNWMLDHIEIADFNGDSSLDVRIVSTGEEVHYFYNTGLGFVDR